MYTGKLKNWLGALLIIALMTGCGGGGGSSSSQDRTAPTVIAAMPADSATGVAVNSTVRATFNENMDPQSLTNSFTVSGMTGTVSYDVPTRTAVYTPSSYFVANTTYTATIATGAKDSAGNPLAQPISWRFTTGGAGDTTAPQVVFTIPFDKETAVPINRAIAATFTEDMDATSLRNSFSLSGVAGDVTYDARTRTAVFTPSGNLTIGSTYTATVTTGAKDLAGNALTTPYSWSFTTASAPNVSPPQITLTIPADKATGVPINGSIAATFSKDIAPMTITPQTFTLSGPSGSVDGIVAYDPATRIATFKPSSALAASTAYTATFTTAVKDLDGNALADLYSWSFTTGAEKDIAPPVVLSLTPPDGATGVDTTTPLSITFNEPVMPFPLGLIDDKPVAVVFTNNNTTATMTPTGGFKSNSNYMADFKSSDVAGNTFEVVWRFSTK